MPMFDLPLEQLKTYLPPHQEPDDFDAFWAKTLNDARRYPLNATFTPVETPFRLLDIYDVTFAGYGGQPIKGWFYVPHGQRDLLPCVVEYIGYGGGRGLPLEWLTWSVAGYAHLVMDTRGQGSSWRTGDTPDIEDAPSNPQFPGFMTRGVLDPHTYYYRRVFTDAVRAIEAVSSHPVVDSSRIALVGGSQGGGITLAATALAPQVGLAMPDVPFLCHYQAALELVESAPYNELTRYLQTHRDKTSQVFRTLSYFDGVNFATRCQAPTLFSVGLMDETCPPRTVFAAYNHYAGEKNIEVYPYNHHEGGGNFHLATKVRWLAEHWPLG